MLISIAVSCAPASIIAGTPAQCSATGTYSDKSTSDITNQATWNSSNGGVASMTGGQAMGIAQGSTSITASLSAISSAGFQLTVTQALLQSIAVTCTPVSISIGVTGQCTAAGTYNNKTTGDITSQASWNSSSTSIATIARGGAPTGVAQGSTGITATFSGITSNSFTLTVTQGTLQSIAITCAPASIAVGATAQCAATGTYNNKSTSDITSQVTWNSSNTGVATISGGQATGLAQGSTMLTATMNTVGSTGFTLLVTQTSIPPASVTITQQTTNSLPNQVNLAVVASQAATNLTGTLSLSFTLDPSVTNVSGNYDCERNGCPDDQSAGFPVTGSSTLASQTSFTVPAGSTPQASVPFAQGTVAGTWTITMTSLTDANGNSVLPNPPPTTQITVPPAAPVIEASTLKITNITSSGFTVQLDGYSTTRSVSSGTFQFTPTSGASLQGATVTVPFNGSDQKEWFGQAVSLPSGGNFSLAIPFSFSGNTSALGTVTVTLTNGVNTSAPASSAPVP